MRHLLFFLSLLAFLPALCAQQPVCMTYDNAGNRSTRLACGSGLADPSSASALEPESTDRDAETLPLPVAGQIVPNPTDGRFDVVLGRAVEGGRFELYGARGERLLQQAAQEGERHSFQLRDLASGNYYLVLRSADGRLLGQWLVLKH